jgi:hypothetical protein
VELVIGSQNVLCFAIKNFSRRGQRDFASSTNALEQTSFEFLFERTDLLADGRLRDEVSFGRE